MAIYTVCGQVVCKYTFDVEADDAVAAEEKARDQLASSYLCMDCDASDITIGTVDKN